jgi:hypothetical protein
VKAKHQSIRLDDATDAIVDKYQAQFGTSRSQTILNLIQAADGKQFVAIITSKMSHHEELSFFAGQLQKVKQLWSEIRSRLAVPRPFDRNDKVGLEKWRNDQAKIQKFYDECDALWNPMHSLCNVLTGISPENLLHLRQAAGLLKAWSKEYQQMAEVTKDPEEKRSYLESKKAFDIAFEAVQLLGIQPISKRSDGQ